MMAAARGRRLLALVGLTVMGACGRGARALERRPRAAGAGATRRRALSFDAENAHVAEHFAPVAAGAAAAGGAAGAAAGAALYGERIARTPMLDLLRSGLSPGRLERLESRLAQRCGSVRLCLENIADEHNAAACLRTFEGLGGQHVHVIESVEHLTPCRAVTKSADRWLTFHRHYEPVDAITELQAAGYHVVATHLDAGSRSIDEVDFARLGKVALLFGNERRGVSKLAARHADTCVVYPMAGFSQSFNISVAVALFLSHIRATGLMAGDLERDELAALYTRWLVTSHKNPKQVLERNGFADCVPYL